MIDVECDMASNRGSFLLRSIVQHARGAPLFVAVGCPMCESDGGEKGGRGQEVQLDWAEEEVGSFMQSCHTRED